MVFEFLFRGKKKKKKKKKSTSVEACVRSAHDDDANAAVPTTGIDPDGNVGALPLLIRKSAVWQPDARADDARSLKNCATVSRPVAWKCHAHESNVSVAAASPSMSALSCWTTCSGSACSLLAGVRTVLGGRERRVVGWGKKRRKKKRRKKKRRKMKTRRSS